VINPIIDLGSPSDRQVPIVGGPFRNNLKSHLIYISLSERGLRQPTLDALLRLAKVLEG